MQEGQDQSCNEVRVYDENDSYCVLEGKDISAELPFHKRKLNEISSIGDVNFCREESDGVVGAMPKMHRKLLFEVVSFKIVEDPILGRKHVDYELKVEITGQDEDLFPIVIERRYNEFLSLYLGLRRDVPYFKLMAEFFMCGKFPKKLITGNFTEKTMFERSIRFEALLSIIASHQSLLESQHVMSFILSRELEKVKALVVLKEYIIAAPLIENMFRLLNKLYTDRHPAVLRMLCLLVACGGALGSTYHKTLQFADLALLRYEAVSDTDLLQYYIPLLKLCVELYMNAGKDKSHLDERLANLKRRGMKVDGLPSLLELVMKDF